MNVIKCTNVLHQGELFCSVLCKVTYDTLYFKANTSRDIFTGRESQTQLYCFSCYLSNCSRLARSWGEMRWWKGKRQWRDSSGSFAQTVYSLYTRRRLFCWKLQYLAIPCNTWWCRFFLLDLLLCKLCSCTG